jgi:hypothetical protein
VVISIDVCAVPDQSQSTFYFPPPVCGQKCGQIVHEKKELWVHGESIITYGHNPIDQPEMIIHAMELTNSALQNMVSVFVFGPYKFLLLIG